MSLLHNIRAATSLVASSLGPATVVVVSGTAEDERFWRRKFTGSTRDLFRVDGSTDIRSVSEPIRKGNFLGTLRAWESTRPRELLRNSVWLMSMVFGQGKRLSPFTQSLGNRKPALPTPLYGKQSRTYLTTAEVSAFYSNILVHSLSTAGFSGALIKWGDEVIIPSGQWQLQAGQLDDIDAVRFLSVLTPSESLARQKEWLLFDPKDKSLLAEFSRQPLGHLLARSELSAGDRTLGVNLGSMAVSWDFLAAASEAFAEDLSREGSWLDWDPYVWIAMLCDCEDQWAQERDSEADRGATGLLELEERIPRFFEKARRLRLGIQRRTGRPFRAMVLDFGNAMWVDFGLHSSLAHTYQNLPEDTDYGFHLRELFGVPHERDERGNIIHRARLPKHAHIANSVVLDSEVLSSDSTVCRATILSSILGRADLPDGGVAIDCAVGKLTLGGPGAIAFRSTAEALSLDNNTCHTTIYLPDGDVDLRSETASMNYELDYGRPVSGNSLSFEEAGALMGKCSWNDVEIRRARVRSRIIREMASKLEAPR